MDETGLIFILMFAFCFAILGLLVWFALARKLAAEKARHELHA